jgi:uncharacterized phage-associated protein
MPFDSKAVANEFLKLAEQDGVKLSPMKLLKLVYFAHGWHLALKGEPLLNERVEAWRYGPVVPSLYHEFKRFGNGPITDEAREDVIERKPSGGLRLSYRAPRIDGSDSDSDFARRLIKRVWDIYGRLPAAKLSNLTHLPQSPWDQTSGKEIKGTDIDNDLIKRYFETLAHQDEQPAHPPNG